MQAVYLGVTPERIRRKVRSKIGRGKASIINQFTTVGNWSAISQGQSKPKGEELGYYPSSLVHQWLRAASRRFAAQHFPFAHGECAHLVTDFAGVPSKQPSVCRGEC